MRESMIHTYGVTMASWVTVFVLTASGAYLESDKGRTDRTAEVEPSRMSRTEPEPENAVKHLIRRVEVGKSSQYGALAIFPLFLHASPEQDDIRTLDEAMDRGWITIRESTRARVPELLVRNDSDHYIFLMSGEIIAGGKQNRIIRSDILLAPHSDFVEIPVYCGEKERWAGSSETFKSAKRLTSQNLRRMATTSEPQGAIWREIDEQLDQADVKSSSRDYGEIYENRQVDRELEKYVSGFRHLCRRETVGVVVIARGRIVGCDLFSDAELLSRLWEKICRSYAVDVLVKPTFGDERSTVDRKRGWPDEVEVRGFLDGVFSARFTSQPTNGVGELMRISGRVEGDALVWRTRPVHVTIFSNDE